MLDPENARAFLREHYDMDVPDDDLMIVTYLCAQLGLNHLEPEVKRIATAATDAGTADVREALAVAQATLVETAGRIAGLKDAMVATVKAAGRLEKLNEEAQASIARMEAASEKMTAAAVRLEKAAMAAAAGQSIKKKGLLG